MFDYYERISFCLRMRLLKNFFLEPVSYMCTSNPNNSFRIECGTGKHELLEAQSVKMTSTFLYLSSV